MSAVSELWDKLNAIPKPVTEEQVLQVARDAAAGLNKDFRQFEQWFEQNKAHVLLMLNDPLSTQ